MAQFQADISGMHSEVSRVGSKNSGIIAYVRSREGQVRVALSHVDGKDYAYVVLEPHSGRGTGSVVLYDGPCDGWKATSVKAA